MTIDDVRPWPAPFTIRRSQAVRERRADIAAKERLRQCLEEMVARGEVCATQAARGRAYYIIAPLAPMEDRLW